MSPEFSLKTLHHGPCRRIHGCLARVIPFEIEGPGSQEILDTSRTRLADQHRHPVAEVVPRQGM